MCIFFAFVTVHHRSRRCTWLPVNVQLNLAFSNEMLYCAEIRTSQYFYVCTKQLHKLFYTNKCQRKAQHLQQTHSQPAEHVTVNRQLGQSKVIMPEITSQSKKMNIKISKKSRHIYSGTREFVSGGPAQLLQPQWCIC